MTESAAILVVVLPAVAAACGLLLARSRSAAREWGVLGALATLAAAVAEAWGVWSSGPVQRVSLLGEVDLGWDSIHLDVRGDQLSALVGLAVAVVAVCVQVYSAGYLADPGTPAAPTRYRAYAAEVSLFTAAMMLVVHADDVVLLLLGWEVMGACSYLLVGHHSERPSARAAAVKAFLVTRVGDLGVLIALVVLLVGARTTSVTDLVKAAPSLPPDVVTAAALLLLAGVAGKSAQFPLHTWLPDAMEGPTPVSALIHAATMVAAGVYLVARLLPLFLAARVAMDVAAVIASITMIGAALAALAQDDLKRLLAWSTISQVAYMLAGVAVARTAADAGPGVFHLLSHAGFKALLFLVAGCVTHVVGSTRLADMGGLLRTHPRLTGLFALGLAALAGLPPFSGFWSKEGVLTAAEDAALGGGWAPRLVLATGLVTTLLTGVYAGRAYAVVAMGEPGERAGGHHHLPRAMTWPLVVLAVPTAGLGLLLVNRPAVLDGVHFDVFTGFTGALLALAGIGWALSVARLGQRDVAAALPDGVRAFLRDGYRLDAVQAWLVVRPYRALAAAAASADTGGVDAVPRFAARLAVRAGEQARRAASGLATGYLAWAVLGALVVGLLGVVLS